MSLRSLASKIAPAIRGIRPIHTTARVNCDHDTRGVFGSNVPFPVHNRYLLFVIFTTFFASGISLPFICLRRMILLKNQQ